MSSSIASVIVISDMMARDYRKIFNCPIHTLRISSEVNHEKKSYSDRKGIVYAGGLGVGRIVPLLEIGRALKKANIPGYDRIHVYTGDRSQKVLSSLIEENGIQYHGMASPDQIEKILGNARYILHIESFDIKAVRRTKYSLSTKIGESLRSGACILAYGPKNIASIEYLRNNTAAVMVKKVEEIIAAVEKYNYYEDEYHHLTDTSAALAEKNHNKVKNDVVMLDILQHAVMR